MSDEKNSLYDKAENAIKRAFETAKTSVKTVSEKAGEAAMATKLLIEVNGLEHKVSKKLAELGYAVYEQSSRQGEIFSLEDPKIKGLIEDIKKLDAEVAETEAKLEKEKQKLKGNK